MRKKVKEESWGLKIRGAPPGTPGPLSYISGITEGNAAANAGLRQYDRLLEINDVDVRKMSYVHPPTHHILPSIHQSAGLSAFA
jgi:hypothetical protein